MMLSMARDDLVAFGTGFRRAVINCEKGRVWVTVAGDSKDYIISAGEELELGLKRRVVIIAEERSHVRVFRPFKPGTVTLQENNRISSRGPQEIVCR